LEAGLVSQYGPLATLSLLTPATDPFYSYILAVVHIPF